MIIKYFRKQQPWQTNTGVCVTMVSINQSNQQKNGRIEWNKWKKVKKLLNSRTETIFFSIEKKDRRRIFFCCQFFDLFHFSSSCCVIFYSFLCYQVSFHFLLFSVTKKLLRKFTQAKHTHTHTHTVSQLVWEKKNRRIGHRNVLYNGLPLARTSEKTIIMMLLRDKL